MEKIKQIHDACLNIIVWCHNFSWHEDLDIYAKEKLVKRLVCVGKEQMDLYLTHKAYNKSDYIYNCIDIDGLISRNKLEGVYSRERGPVVTYMGSLVPWKGFHILAKAWKSIVKAVPQAQLFVMGAGNLYSRHETLGSYGIASENYEKQFIPFLLNDEGKLIDSVHFMGLMGPEKYNLLAMTKVGVVNPSGISETFGISAVEMQVMGAKVIARKCAGFLDTVRYGQLFLREDELRDCVINALLETNSNTDVCLNGLLSDFSYKRFISEWERYLKEVINSKRHLHNPSLTNPDFNNKKRKFVFFKYARVFPFLYNANSLYHSIWT